jgi:hypothetical protein
MKFPIFVIVGIIGVAVANNTVYMNQAENEHCRNLEAGGALAGGGKCCDFNSCHLCFLKERCCYKEFGGGSVGRCKCGVNDYPQGTCY